MKCYLVFDKTLGSYFCPNPGNTGWLNENYKEHCLIENKEQAQKLMRAHAQFMRSTVQLLEVEMPRAEYEEIQENLRINIKACKRAGVVVGQYKDIKEQIDAKRKVQQSNGDK